MASDFDALVCTVSTSATCASTRYAGCRPAIAPCGTAAMVEPRTADQAWRSPGATSVPATSISPRRSACDGSSPERSGHHRRLARARLADEADSFAAPYPRGRPRALRAPRRHRCGSRPRANGCAAPSWLLRRAGLSRASTATPTRPIDTTSSAIAAPGGTTHQRQASVRMPSGRSPSTGSCPTMRATGRRGRETQVTLRAESPPSPRAGTVE